MNDAKGTSCPGERISATPGRCLLTPAAMKYGKFKKAPEWRFRSKTDGERWLGVGQPPPLNIFRVVFLSGFVVHNSPI